MNVNYCTKTEFLKYFGHQVSSVFDRKFYLYKLNIKKETELHTGITCRPLEKHQHLGLTLQDLGFNGARLWSGHSDFESNHRIYSFTSNSNK